MPAPTRARRTQEERTAETRKALIDAAIEVIHEVGYNAASNALIAEKAGVSRGAIIHQFGTRSTLMSEVVADVYVREMNVYSEIVAAGKLGNRIFHWPKILLDVLGRPSGTAVLEILMASQSDSDLAVTVRDRQKDIEAAALATMRADFGGEEASALTVMRLMVWAVRGMSIADRVMPGGIDKVAPIALLSALLQFAAPKGSLPELEALMATCGQAVGDPGETPRSM